jgi:hypothetical protein
MLAPEAERKKGTLNKVKLYVAPTLNYTDHA